MMKQLTRGVKKNKLAVLVFVICTIFFISYAVLTIIRHNHFGSFGYDLGINDQVVWRYSTFQLPYTTSDPFPDQTKLVAHIELTYILLAPFYWVWSDARMLLILEAGFVSFSAFAMFLLARRHKLHQWIQIVIPISFLMFYGVQNAIWADAHSATFAASYLSWFIYFVDSKRFKLATVFLILSILTKENIALLTFLLSFVFYIHLRRKILLGFMGLSILYLLFAYLIFFPYIVPHDYLYQNEGGLLSNINPLSLIDNTQKIETIIYSFASFGFLPFLAPLYLLPVIGHFGTYFILASDLTASHGIFQHYRVTLTPLLTLGTIMAISKIKLLNRRWIAIYLLCCTLFMQYYLHLPLSYLSKSWFWTKPSSVDNIHELLKTLPKNASVVSQNNLIPHISQRDKIYTLYPDKKTFSENSICEENECDWFRWFDSPEYLIVDTSGNWDTRHFLTDRDNYIQGLRNLEKTGIIKRVKTFDTAVLYTILKNPSD